MRQGDGQPRISTANSWVQMRSLIGLPANAPGQSFTDTFTGADSAKCPQATLSVALRMSFSGCVNVMVTFSTASEDGESVVIGAVNSTVALRMSKASIRALRTFTGSMNARLHDDPSADRFRPRKYSPGLIDLPPMLMGRSV